MTAAMATTEHPAALSLPVGADLLDAGGVRFRVWAPQRRSVAVVLESGPGSPAEIELEREANGYFSARLAQAGRGTRYRYRLDGDKAYPDPASRYQLEGPHGSSEVIDPRDFQWSDQTWKGLRLKGQVFYEMHVGTFTVEGTWAAAARELPALGELGVTAVEIMPVADFPGRFGWGYDGTSLFAPSHLYGTPDDFRRFVDRAHALGIGVLLDVVYNHFGPDGCYLGEFSQNYFNSKRRSEWGDTPNFDGPDCAPVREFFLGNAAYWIAEFHLDGLRLDATQSIWDDSSPHFLLELGRRTRAAAAGRDILIVNENEPQHARLVRSAEQDGYGLDMLWNDDWHHSAIVAATAQDDAYYTDYGGSAQELVSAAKYGFLYQGQWYRWQRQRRGTPAFDIEPTRFVHFLANHDQVANTGGGNQPHRFCSPGRWRALTALLLLGPQTPLLFQGQEFATNTPFLYFADHHPELAQLVAAGRHEFVGQFASLAQPEMISTFATPHDIATFQRCKLDHAERERPGHREVWLLHRDLLRLRREDACFGAQTPHAVDGAVLGPDAFVLRYFGRDEDDRLLVINLSRTLHLNRTPEPLLAPPTNCSWEVLWSSQSPCYGGIGTLPPDAAESDFSVSGRGLPRPEENWRLQGESAIVLKSAPKGQT